MPDFAYLELLTPATIARLRQDPLVRAIVPYRPEYKIAPRIGTRAFKTAERQAVRGLWLRCVLFKNAAIEEVAIAIERLGGTNISAIDDRSRGGDPKIQFQAPSADIVPRVAEIPSVKIVEEVAEQKDDNANLAGTNQSGTPGTRSIWSAGIHGETPDHRDD